METPDLSDVAVVILNFNTVEFLGQFLPKVIAYSGKAQVVVADNGSSDGSAQLVSEKFPEALLIKIPENKGFCAGYNYALSQIQATYYVLLNSDVEVTPGWLLPLHSLLERNSQIACCQPKILSWHQRDRFEYAGAAGGLIDALGYPFCRGRLFDHLERDEAQYNDTKPVFWATGACLFIRASLYHEVGGLDERFFAHMEEIDLCWRLKRHGHEVYYQGKSQVFHVGGGTLAASSPRKTYFNFRNNLFLLTKNLPLGRLAWLLPLRLVLDGLAAIKLLGQPNGLQHVTAILKAHIAWYRALPTLLKQRGQVKHSGLPLAGWYKGSVVVDYFLKKRKKVGGGS